MAKGKVKVLVAMSGGVDSSVAALLLQEQGYEVIGVTLNLWSYEGRLEPYNECCSLEVSTVAKQLGIEHHFLDLGQEFKEQVIDHFIAEYAAGRTPSPCMRCNRYIRFPRLLKYAKELGCDYLATGHYARIEFSGKYFLKKGLDEFKDQSYFLYSLTQDELRHIMFPIGTYRKEEIWKIAAQHNLVAARKPESQDLCFVPNRDYHDFLRAKMNGMIKEGEIVDLNGRVLGQHKGLPFYTIGQRGGLGLSTGKRLYVVGLDPQKNRVIVGEERDLYAEGLIVADPSFVYIKNLKGPEPVEAKIRYRSPEASAQVFPTAEGKLLVSFEKPQRAVTPGQAVVFYKGDKVFGGGTIESLPAL